MSDHDEFDQSASDATASDAIARDRDRYRELNNHDVQVLAAETEFRPVPFGHPLVLSSGTITALTEARVRVVVRNRAGVEAEGLGSVLLSHVWAGSADAPMRAAVRALADAAVGSAPGDPLQLGVQLLALVRSRGVSSGIPPLAAAVALAPVDQAVHDAWAKAVGASAYQLYRAPYLNADLGHYLGADFAGRWPGEWLARVPRSTLEVQYVLGLADPIEAAEGYRWVKVKLAGDAAADVARVREVGRLGARISLDPNEGYTSAGELAKLLGAVDADYIEQPTPRDALGPGVGTGGRAAIPALVDEGLPDPQGLDGLAGWDGVVVKTCRGQTSALLTYSWARHRGRYVVQQDLTHVGAALAHAAALAARCEYSVPAFECNSLQYAPDGNRELALAVPGLVTVVDGAVSVPEAEAGIR